MKVPAVAPCQCASPGGVWTVSPARMRMTVPSRVATSPTPSVTCKVWPTACECQLVCAPGVNRTSATVIRGIEGFGAKQHLHTTRILSFSTDLPILIEVVDQDDRIRSILPEVDAMVGDGLITLERVEVIAYRASTDEET